MLTNNWRDLFQGSGNLTSSTHEVHDHVKIYWLELCPNFFPTISISKFKKRVFSCFFSASKLFSFSLVGVMQGSFKIAHFGGIGLDVNIPKKIWMDFVHCLGWRHINGSLVFESKGHGHLRHLIQQPKNSGKPTPRWLEWLDPEWVDVFPIEHGCIPLLYLLYLFTRGYIDDFFISQSHRFTILCRSTVQMVPLLEC